MDYIDVSERESLKDSQERRELKRKNKKINASFININKNIRLKYRDNKIIIYYFTLFILFILIIYILFLSFKKNLKKQRDLFQKILNEERNISNYSLTSLNNKYKELKKEYKILKNKNKTELIKYLAKKNSKIVAISYGNSDFKEALKYNQQSALEIAKVNEYYSYGPEDIDKDFKEKNNNILSEPRGNGYWLWKPYFILKTFKEKLNEGDYLIYSDAGTLYIDKAEKIVDFMIEKNVDMYLYRNSQLEREYTKRDAFILLGVDSPFYSETGQFNATFQIYRKTRLTEIFLEEYLYYSQDKRIITDDPNVLGKENYDGFLENRNVQSILSLLTKKYEQVNSNRANVDINIVKNFTELMPIIFCNHRGTKFENYEEAKKFCQVNL